MSEQDCLFCKIVAGEIPADIVFESDSAIAFRDINPQAPTHVLVIPRRHISTVNHLEEDDRGLVGDLYLAAKAIAAEEGFGFVPANVWPSVVRAPALSDDPDAPAAARLFVRDDQGGITKARNLASAIQRQRADFKPLRDAVHNQISAPQIPRIEAYRDALPPGALRKRCDELVVQTVRAQ